MIKNVLSAKGLGAFFYDDQAAIRGNAVQKGFLYEGAPVTAGFTAIRMPAEVLSVGLVLDDGFVAWGDMMSVQYSGAGGREPVFKAEVAERFLSQVLMPRLLNVSLSSFRMAVAEVLEVMNDGQSIPLSVQYGVSQAILRAVAHKKKQPMAVVLAREYAVPLVRKPVPLYAQSGDERYGNVVKMVLKQIGVLPHGLINSIEKFGKEGERFIDYVKWVVNCVQQFGGETYRPELHFDVYGTIGLAFDNDVRRMADYICRVTEVARPFDLNIECPGDFGSTSAQIESFAMLRELLRSKGCNARIVVDEWCDTLDDVRRFIKHGAADIIQIKMPDIGSVTQSVESVLLCKKNGVGAYLGGSSAETDMSAQVSVHVAVASQADMQLAKPGMGVDEAICIVGNEQARLMAELAAYQEIPELLLSTA